MPPTIHESAAAIRAGTLTPVDLLERCLARVDELEEKVRAWVFVDREFARAEALRLTDELKKGHHRGPLHGIPIGVKDIFDVFDWPTAAGSKLWANSIARRDATVVERLRQAGAVLMGKTVTTAYASFDPPVTRNPWDLSKTPGGSSSGSAAAVACGMCLGALASQTGGSITRPASFCGVCGIKPTYGRVSVDGVVPLAPSMDHVGVMANCVRDLAILYQAIAIFPGNVLGWLDSVLAPDSPPPFLTLSRLHGMFDEMAEPPMRDAMRSIDLTSGSRRKVEIRDDVPPAGFAEILARHQMVMAVEAAEYHAPRLRRHPEDYPPRIRGLIEEGLACPATEYRRSLKLRGRLRRQVKRLDYSAVLLTPATTGPSPDAATTGNPAFNSPWSFTGLPTVSFPFARTREGLPLAIQLVGKENQDDNVLAAAAWCERAIGFDRREVRLP